MTTGAAPRRQPSSPVGLATRPWTRSPTWGASCSTRMTQQPRPGRLRNGGPPASRSSCRLLGLDLGPEGEWMAAVATAVTERRLSVQALPSDVWLLAIGPLRRRRPTQKPGRSSSPTRSSRRRGSLRAPLSAGPGACARGSLPAPDGCISGVRRGAAGERLVLLVRCCRRTRATTTCCPRATARRSRSAVAVGTGAGAGAAAIQRAPGRALAPGAGALRLPRRRRFFAAPPRQR